MLVASGTLELFAAGTARPGNVTGFKSVQSYKSVVLKWNKVSNADGYLIVWTCGNSTGKIAVDGPNTTAYRHAVSEGKHFQYSIYAVKTTTPGHYSSKYNSKWKSQSATPAKVGGEAVRLMKNKIVFGEGRTLYSHTGGSVRHYFPYGFSTLTTGYDNGRYVFWYNGLQYMVSRLSISNSSAYYIKPSYTYGWGAAESTVNTAKLTSRTNYLIWVNQYTQKLYVFKRNSKGVWACVKGGWAISSGKPSTPTDTGVTRIKDKEYYGTPMYWNICSVFSIHGRLSSYGTLDWPKSNGCVRNANDHALWIYNNCPIGTTVWVY